MRKTIIIGGVAAGAAAAARLRRLDESMEIVLIERNGYISYANCGLPYYVGDVIKEREKLIVTPVETMRTRFNVDVRTEQEVTAIDRTAQSITVRKKDGTVYEENYDALLIATGSSPLRPRIPGIGTEGIYTLWTVEDTDRIRVIVDEKKPRTAAVIGGGFIGLEMAENLHARGIHVSIMEAMDQVMAPLDPEMAQLLHRNIIECGTALYLHDGVASFEKAGDQVKVILQSGTKGEKCFPNPRKQLRAPRNAFRVLGNGCALREMPSEPSEISVRSAKSFPNPRKQLRAPRNAFRALGNLRALRDYLSQTTRYLPD